MEPLVGFEPTCLTVPLTKRVLSTTKRQRRLFAGVEGIEPSPID